MARLYYILAPLLFWTSFVFADDVTFTATVSKSQVSTGERFQISFSVNSNGSEFVPPDFTGFRVLSGPNQSSSMSWINGAMSANVSYSYILMAVETGEYTIGAASISVEGDKLTSAPVKIKVTKGEGVQQNNATPQDRSEPQQKSGNTADISKELFIRAVVDKTQVYTGEQLTVSYRLYTRINLNVNDFDKLPDLNGFWSQDVTDNGQNVQWKTESYNGISYHVADIKQSILFAQRSGNLTIDPLIMTVTIRQSRPARDIIDDFFGAFEDVQHKIKSKPVTVHVKPLPDEGKPASFTGAVGNFSIGASLDKEELKANEALDYKFKISGSGNIKLLKEPIVDFPADFEKYDPKVTDNISEAINGVSGTREYDYLLIPRHEGSFTIPAINFSYFNPSEEQYVTLSTKPYQVKVNKGASDGSATTFIPGDQHDVKMLNEDIRYIKTGNDDLHKKGESLYGSLAYYLLLLIGPCLFMIALAYRKWHLNSNNDLVKVKSKKANKVAAKHLSNAKKQLLGGNKKAFYEDIFKGIYGYLSDKLSIPVSNLSKETISNQLKARNVTEKLVEQLIDTLNICEMARFAPTSSMSEQEVFEKAKRVINDIEDEI